MPGLLRGMARTAVVAGTATAVSNRVSRRQASRWADQDAPAYMAQTGPAPGYAEPPPAAPAAADSRVDQLKDLADLKAQGVLSEQEFAAEKARILGS
jgi:putative oligomerization/nucleic acid binding protein